MPPQKAAIFWESKKHQSERLEKEPWFGARFKAEGAYITY